MSKREFKNIIKYYDRELDVNKYSPMMERTSILDNVKDFLELESIYNNYNTNAEIYEEAYVRKLSFNKDILNGLSRISIKKNTSEIKVQMIKVLIGQFAESLHYDTRRVFNIIKIDGKTFNSRKELRDIILNMFSDKELKSNRIDVDMVVVDKKYQKGSKVTSVLTHICRALDHYGEYSEKIIGKMYPKDQEVELYISAHPMSNILAGIIGNSCLSPDGCNFPATLANIGYKNLLVVHDEFFTWRSFVAVDYVQKRFYLNSGYPYSSVEKSAIIYNYFTEKGFLHNDSFDFPEYFSYDSIFSNEGEMKKNTDAFYNYSERVNEPTSGESIVAIYENQDGNLGLYYEPEVYYSEFHDDYIEESECFYSYAVNSYLYTDYRVEEYVDNFYETFKEDLYAEFAYWISKEVEDETLHDEISIFAVEKMESLSDLEGNPEDFKILSNIISSMIIENPCGPLQAILFKSILNSWREENLTF